MVNTVTPGLVVIERSSQGKPGFIWGFGLNLLRFSQEGVDQLFCHSL